MSRGYCYDISSDLDKYPVGLLDPSDVYDYESRPFGATSAIDADDPAGIAQTLLDDWKSHGASAGPARDEDGLSLGDIVAVTFPADFRVNYYARRLQRLRELVTSMPVEDFAIGTATAGSLASIVDDDSDLVMLDGSFYTLDDFLRTATPGQTYYLSTSTVLVID